MMVYSNWGLPGWSLTVSTHIHTFEYLSTINLLNTDWWERVTGYLLTDYGVVENVHNGFEIVSLA